MYLHVNNVFLITICLTFSIAHMERKKECIELRINNTKSVSDQNKTSFLPKDSKQNISNTSHQPNEQQLAEYDRRNITTYLTKEMDLSILNIPYTKNEEGIDILKSATSFSKKSENKKEADSEGNDNRNRLVTKAIKDLRSDETETTDFNFIHNKNENIIGILKAASKSMEDNKKAKDDKNDLEEIGLRYNGNFSSLFNINNSLKKSFNVSTDIHNTTESHLTFNETILSELIDLSLNDEESLTIGQKINFQNSSMNSATEDAAGSAGADILKDISGTCGSLFGKRISFANATTLLEFPWTALLLYNTKIRYHCGGSLITRKYVLTAAHCVAQEFHELTGVRLGEHDVTEPIDCAPDLAGDTICATTVDADVVKIIVHHEYSYLSFKNDIALLRLDKDYINRSYYPICIPTPEMMYNDRKATVAGWGATEKAIRSTVLLKADVPIYDISKCREIYRYSVFNESMEICGSGANEVDVCKGDSGGALFYNQNVRGKNKFYQLGIISLGVRRCGDSRFLPAVFTKLNGFYKWIENNLEY